MKILLIPLILLFSGCNTIGSKPEQCIPVTVTEYQYRIPEIPHKALTLVEKPYVSSWEGKTERDVAEYILLLNQAVDSGNTKLSEIKNYLNSLREQQSTEELQENNVNN